MSVRLLVSCAALGCFVTGGALAQCPTGRTVLPERGSFTGRVVVGPGGVRATGRVDLPHGGRLTFHTGRAGSPVVVRGRGTWTSPVPPTTTVVVTPRHASRRDPWCDTQPRRVVVVAPRPVNRGRVVVRGGGCESPIPVCEPAPARTVNVLAGGAACAPAPGQREVRVVVGNAYSPTAVCPPAQTRVVCQEPIPWAEPVAAPCPTVPTAARGPADWTGHSGRGRAIQSLPGPAAVCDPLDPTRDALTPPPAELLAEELLLALASEDLARACHLARWLDGRPRYERQVTQAFYARTPSPTLLRRLTHLLARDCGGQVGQGSLLRLLGAAGSGDQ